MKLPSEQLVLEETYGAMQFFRALGFPSDNLYLRPDAVSPMGPFAGQLCIAVLVRWNGKEYNYAIAPVKDYDAFVKKWQRFGEDANEGRIAAEELARIMKRSQCWLDGEAVIASMLAKDITPPLGKN